MKPPEGYERVVVQCRDNWNWRDEKPAGHPMPGISKCGLAIVNRGNSRWQVYHETLGIRLMDWLDATPDRLPPLLHYQVRSARMAYAF